MDVHVLLPITRGLRRRGVDVLTAREDQTTRLLDPELLRRARELGRILFSQDEDLIAEAVRCQREGEPLATVVFVRQPSKLRNEPPFNLLACPRRFSQKSEAGLHARIAEETADRDA